MKRWNAELPWLNKIDLVAGRGHELPCQALQCRIKFALWYDTQHKETKKGKNHAIRCHKGSLSTQKQPGFAVLKTNPQVSPSMYIPCCMNHA